MVHAHFRGRNEVATVPPIELAPHHTSPLPDDLAKTVALTATGSTASSAVFPPGSTADVYSFQFERDGVVNDTLRVYLPQDTNGVAQQDRPLPLLFAVYPGAVDSWESVSTAFAAQGYAVVALSPVAPWGVAVDQHATDARIALQLAFDGTLHPRIATDPAVALGGSFSSAVLHRLLRDEPDRFAGWVTVGGFADAFAAADDFYRGRLNVPDQYRLLVPAMGNPAIFPTLFMQYSPVYSLRTAAEPNHPH